VLGSEPMQSIIAKQLIDSCARFQIEVTKGAITTNYLSLNLPWPLEANEREVINTIIQHCPHELKVDAPD
jgi:hypothetical protein